MFDVREVLAKPMKDMFRECMPTQLSYVYRRLLERAVDLDAQLINQATWNDYPEGHHLAPEINHNFGFPLILKHYERRWRGETGDEPETVTLLFKKYAHTVKPLYFPVPYRFQKYPENEPMDDFIDVVCILNSEAELYVRGQRVASVGRGLSSTLVPSSPGPVSAEVRRAGKPVLSVTAPEWITDKPYRTDRMTYVYSSDNDQAFHAIFGDVPVPVSDEYAQDKDGVPNWKKRYAFWKGLPAR
jgi:hypothetical protein